MPFITFIYRIGNNNKVFYGKYVCDYISDDHDGLDNEIKCFDFYHKTYTLKNDETYVNGKQIK